MKDSWGRHKIDIQSTRYEKRLDVDVDVGLNASSEVFLSLPLSVWC
jgi:hypothetical protein